MSDHKLVSPLLDGFIMGDAMSNHDGVYCCPAMKENSDEKYIVKIISVPASQKQLDALLLTGACEDAGAAMEYFKERAEEVVKEAELLLQLSKLEGFLPYDNWQIVPMEHNNLGYEVYLVGSYKRSLEKFLRRNTMTHLGAVNLGLDLCSALSVCRRAGFVHVDLKPSNIFLSGDREYRIGDLGFVKLNSLRFASLPSKYRSSYTPPELHDEMATLNPTVDIYAVGLIMYQIYNNGQLPFETPDFTEPLPAPANADYELAEIILKAVHPNPRHRWQTPIEMGQALAGYMQRNGVNDDPIVPPMAAPAAEAEEESEAAPETAEVPEELAFMEEVVSDETAPSDEDGEALADVEMTEEVSDMLAQAEELLTDREPEVSQAEEAAEVPQEAGDDDHSFFANLFVTAQEDDEYDDDEDDEVIPVISENRQKKRGWVAPVIVMLVLALLAGAAYYYYTTYYLLPIDKMDISTVEDTITVNLTTQVDETLLTVVCTDTYGNTSIQPVVNGKAVFTGLNSGSLYNITVEAEGFHKTSESNSGSCSTAKQTEILDFTAKTGNEDGSVILSFAVSGPETQDWLVEYTAEEEEPGTVSFTGHTVTVTGLTVGKTYTFTLVPASESEMWIVGTNTLDYTASRIVVAQNLTIDSCGNGILTTSWEIPADAQVESWTVRCYSETGYDKTVTVTEPAAQFDGIADADAYTVEVTADGMSQSARTFVTANPTTITDIETVKGNALNITWTYTGTAPEGGWLLMYSVNGGKTTEVIKCNAPAAVIENPIPKAVYQITIQAADGSTVFNGTTQFNCPQAKAFDQYSLSSDELMVSLCKTPDKANWTHEDVSEYPSTYAAGTRISMVLYATGKFYTYNEDAKVTFIIRDAEGNVLTELMSSETRNWQKMWNKRYAYLDIPALPEDAGEYTIDLYFNDQYVLTKKVTVTE